MSNPDIQRAIDQSIDSYLAHLDGQHSGQLYALMIGEAEAALLRNVLRRCDNNQSQAAKLLGITRNTLKKKMCAHGLYKL
ncbi:Fis family transcriptional regulator [Suttonella sp. R2A3]|uniref:helix-turn-helix domain-containing protein n=1 Tax=Suttonella sp. R2A3 TaxID=2908648 RepID=UPI001F2D75BE|nr:helix-turn-helix domain-containing protein [Suttonella sp. R2A3]UJF24186.1 Fis family transcriptional regulator [Suttonella sp. R2A3]